MASILQQFKDKFHRYSDGTDGMGCDTCGYGAGSTMSEDAYEQLLRDIDAFSQTFQTKPESGE